MVKSINESNKIFADLLNGQYPAIMGLTWGFVDVRDVAQAHTRALTAHGIQGRYICAGATLSMREVVGLLKENGFAGVKLPRMGLDSVFGNKLAYLASFTQPMRPGPTPTPRVSPNSFKPRSVLPSIDASACGSSIPAITAWATRA